jgi:precorrin-2 dehydrogenase / sirohydrochlorin ferrochelatase
LIMLPLFLDLRPRKVVVFGGGAVGLRKANFFTEEAEVVVVSRDFAPGFDGSEISLMQEDADANLDRWVAWADFIVAATDDHQLNERIVNAAMRQNKYCNSAEGISNFLIPSLVRRENYDVAVSTLGRSPAMSKYLRLKLEGYLTDEYSHMIALQEELRAMAKGRIPDQRSRERYLWDILEDENIWTKVRAGEMDQARHLAEARMVSYIGNDP